MIDLHLTGWTVTAERQNPNGDYLLDAEYAVQPATCPHCNSSDLYRFGFSSGIYMDLPVQKHRVGLMVKKQRFQCKNCRKTFVQPTPDLDDKRLATRRMITYVGEESLNKPFVEVARETGFDEGTVREIFADAVDDLEKWYMPDPPQWLGIDEAHLDGRMRCVITNLKERQVIDVLKTRSQKAVAARLNSVLDRDQVELVSIDMWRPYYDAVQALLPKAIVVIDKFHVVRMASDALETVRKSNRKGLTDAQRRVLKHDRFLLLKRRYEVDVKDRIVLDYWLRNFPVLCLAYDLKEAFYDIWDLTDHDKALEQYHRWTEGVTDDVRKAFDPLLTALGNWEEPIFNYFRYPVTNAYTEAINGIIKLVNRRGRGYSFEVLRAKILFGQKLQARVLDKFDRDPNSYSVCESRGYYTARPMTRREQELSTLAEQIYSGLDPLHSTVESE